MENELMCSICGMKESDTSKFYKNSKLGKDLCNRHYIQLNRFGRITDGGIRPTYKNLGTKCCVCEDNVLIRCCGVEGEYKFKPLCSKHYSQIITKGVITDKNKTTKGVERVCSYCGKKDGEITYSPKHGDFLCRRHYDHLLNYGKILSETIFDRNSYNLISDENGDYAEIILKNVKFETVGIALIDAEDLDVIIKHKWNLGTWNYAQSTSSDGEILYMHKILINHDDIVDHKNRNTLDNRKLNLRKANKSLNAINCDIRTNNTSGVTGVSWNKRTNSWRVYLNWDSKRIELGHRREIEDAIILRLNSEVKYFKDFSPQKHLFKKYNIESEGYDE